MLVAFLMDVDVVAQLIDHSQNAHHDFPRGERSNRRAADSPIPTERPDGRLDPMPGPAEEAEPLMQAGGQGRDILRFIEFGGGGRIVLNLARCAAIAAATCSSLLG